MSENKSKNKSKNLNNNLNKNKSKNLNNNLNKNKMCISPCYPKNEIRLNLKTYDLETADTDFCFINNTVDNKNKKECDINIKSSNKNLNVEYIQFLSYYDINNYEDLIDVIKQDTTLSKLTIMRLIDCCFKSLSYEYLLEVDQVLKDLIDNFYVKIYDKLLNEISNKENVLYKLLLSFIKENKENWDDIIYFNIKFKKFIIKKINL